MKLKIVVLFQIIQSPEIPFLFLAVINRSKVASKIQTQLPEQFKLLLKQCIDETLRMSFVLGFRGNTCIKQVLLVLLSQLLIFDWGMLLDPLL